MNDQITTYSTPLPPGRYLIVTPEGSVIEMFSSSAEIATEESDPGFGNETRYTPPTHIKTELKIQSNPTPENPRYYTYYNVDTVVSAAEDLKAAIKDI